MTAAVVVTETGLTIPQPSYLEQVDAPQVAIVALTNQASIQFTT